MVISFRETGTVCDVCFWIIIILFCTYLTWAALDTIFVFGSSVYLSTYFELVYTIIYGWPNGFAFHTTDSPYILYPSQPSTTKLNNQPFKSPDRQIRHNPTVSQEMEFSKFDEADGVDKLTYIEWLVF